MDVATPGVHSSQVYCLFFFFFFKGILSLMFPEHVMCAYTSDPLYFLFPFIGKLLTEIS